MDGVIDSVAAVLLVLMSLVLALQVVFRYVLNRPLSWPLEVSLLFFVWLVWIGGIGGMRDEKQIRIEFAEKYLPRPIQRILMPANTVVCLIFLGFVIFYGVQVAESQRSAVYDILPFSRGVLYAIAPVAGTLMFVSLLRVLARQIRRYSSPAESLKERDH